MKKVLVASTNPVKIQGALDGFRRMFPDQEFEAEGAAITSGVSNQPMADGATLQGAINRVNNALKAKPGMDFYVGIEDAHDGMREVAWVVVASRDR
jgi:non-canonical (house-cleaning) NTP pyrophosphatase